MGHHWVKISGGTPRTSKKKAWKLANKIEAGKTDPFQTVGKGWGGIGYRRDRSYQTRGPGKGSARGMPEPVGYSRHPLNNRKPGEGTEGQKHFT